MTYRGNALMTGNSIRIGLTRGLALVSMFVLAPFLMMIIGCALPASATPSSPQITLTFVNPGTVTLPLVDVRGAFVTGGSLVINWGDGTTSSSATHRFTTSGTFHVQVSAPTTVVCFGSAAAAPLTTLTEVTNWSGPWQSFSYAFSGDSSLTTVPSTLPSTVTDLTATFLNATSFDQDLR